jgi:hypothetical protein
VIVEDETMRRLLLPVLFAALGSPLEAMAQERPKLEIADVRIGFPAGTQGVGGDKTNHAKASHWTPVYVYIQAGREGLQGTEGPITLVVEAEDADNVLANYRVSKPLSKLGPSGMDMVVAFVKPASTNPEITVSLEYDGRPLGKAVKKQQMVLDSGQILYLAVGDRLPDLKQAMDFEAGVKVNQTALFDSMRENLSWIDRVGDMPVYWFGYDGVDVVILLTSNDNPFLKDLQAEVRHRDALAEWVQRGGHLIVAAGKNQGLLAAFPELEQLLPVKLTRADPEKNVHPAWTAGQLQGLKPLRATKEDPIVARFVARPGREYVSLMKRSDDKAGQDLIVQGPAGLGRVTVLLFDVDREPFTSWPSKAVFWRDLLNQAWPRTAAVGVAGQNPNVIMWGQPTGGSTQMLTQIYNYLENFEEVPVISFGWVALFIFIYILVVGPLDYFFLKKVVKRMELTWITFPTVVLTISAVAYFTAYWIKGKDLRIRKADLVDIDLTGPQPMMVGHTWFTLFSPRIRHYTIGIEPVAGEWVAPPERAPANREVSTMVSWLGRPEMDKSVMGRSRGQGLFRRAYDYESAARGLRGVPINVWATKSFSATWLGYGDPDHPLFSAQLAQQPGDRRTLTGQITWLPGAAQPDASLNLNDAWLVYQNQVTRVQLVAGKATSITKNDARMELSLWLQESGTFFSQNQQPWAWPPRRGQTPQNPMFGNLDYPMRPVLFFEMADRAGGMMQNNCLRLLDQSWRLRDLSGEAVLIARLGPRQGPAQEVSQNLVSPTRLWLDRLPGDGGPVPALDGILHQHTYIRVFIPVQRN